MTKRMTLFLVLALLISSFGVLPTNAQDATLLIWADEVSAPIIEELSAPFAEEYGVTIEVQQIPFGDIRGQFVQAAPTGEGPDLFIGAHDWLGEMVANGLVAPVDLGDDTESFAEPAINAFTYEGDLYGVPYAIENVALFYNTELVETAPTTWDEVRTVSEEIIEGGAADYGFLIQQGDAFHFMPIQTAFGGYVFGLDEEGNYNPEDVGIDSEGSIAALAWVESMVDDGLNPAGLGGGDIESLFIAGDAAMLITGPWNVNRFVEAEVPFAIAPIPGSGDMEQGAPFLGARGFMVNAFSANPVLAQAFLTDFVATEEFQQAAFDAEGRPPAYLPVAEMVESEYVTALLAAGENAQPMPAIPAMGDVWGAWGNAITLVMQGELTAEEAFTQAAETIREAIAE
ncbi:MAG: maltose ABC transporter substrate-binding protein [Anaerolineae bacterium]|nr:maltose ABC transporter substrate-binding protein [Anaerolineae bacterium]